MRIEKISRVGSARVQANRWSPGEDLILMLMVGKGHTYAEIALRLGRSATAVQRRASKKGYSQRQEWAEQASTRARLSQARREAMLAAEEADLAAYVPECFEEPVLPHVGGRTYHREYMRNRRAEES